MNFQFKKSQSLISSKLIVIILIILVLVFVLILIFRPDIINYIKNVIPEYNYAHDQEINPPSSQAAESYCKFKVAVITEGTKINFCANGDCNNLVSSKLLYKSDGIYYNRGLIGWYTDSLRPDKKVADLTAKDLIVFKSFDYLYQNKFLDKDVSVLGYSSIYELLLNLDSSYYWQSNIICRPSKISINEIWKSVPIISSKNIGDAEVMDKARASKYYFEEGSNEKMGVMVFITDQIQKSPYVVYGDANIVYVYSNGKWHPFATITLDNKVKAYVPYNVLEENIGSKPK